MAGGAGEAARREGRGRLVSLAARQIYRLIFQPEAWPINNMIHSFHCVTFACSRLFDKRQESKQTLYGDVINQGCYYLRSK